MSRRNPDRMAAIVAVAIAATTLPAGAQSVQYQSPVRVEYRAQADTGPIARAQGALAADPRNVERIIALGVAQSGARQFREAIETFTRGLAIAPNDPMLYRWRGHRYLSVRDFERAKADLTRGFQLDSTNYGILYHLGVVRYALGDYAGAADAFRRAQPRAPSADELAGATDWLWMSLSRAGRAAEAKAMLDRRPDSLPSTNAYAKRLRLYRGEIGPEAVITAADTADVQLATLAYGVGNWHLLRGDTAQARAAFERSVNSGGWAGFGFILSELELRDTEASCVPLSQRVANEFGCFITATQELGVLPSGAPIFWRIDAFPTRAAAERARTANGTVVESLGRVWLFTIGPKTARASGGEHIADIGPLPIEQGSRYAAQYMEAVFRPGMRSRVHRHPGPEAWYTLSGAICLETPAGRSVGVAGGQHVVVLGGPPMELMATGNEVRRSLALVLHDASKPASVLAPDWTPKNLCGR